MLKDAWLPGEFVIDVKWQSDPDEKWSGAWREQDFLRASSMLAKQVLSGGVGIFLSVACCLEGNVGGSTRICMGLGMVEVVTKLCQVYKVSARWVLQIYAPQEVVQVNFCWTENDKQAQLNGSLVCSNYWGRIEYQLGRYSESYRSQELVWMWLASESLWDKNSNQDWQYDIMTAYIWHLSANSKQLHGPSEPLANPSQAQWAVRNIDLAIKLYAYFKIPFLVFLLTISNWCFIIIFIWRYATLKKISDKC